MNSRALLGVGRRRAHRRVRFESLEVRRLLATFTVNAIGDDPTVGGPVSLREAIDLANADSDPDTIEFDPSLSGETILLTQGQLEISSPLSINGLGQDLLTIDAQQDSRVLNIVGDSIDVSISGLTITGGRVIEDNQFIIGAGYDTTYSGGGIRFLSNGELTLTDSTVLENSTTGFAGNGGGIFTRSGSLKLIGSTLLGNSTNGAIAGGGGIYNIDGSVTLTDTILLLNRTTGPIAHGGGIANIDGSVTLTDSSLLNSKTSGISALGGGIYMYSGSLTLTGSNVSQNSTEFADTPGGGIHNTSGSVTLIDSTVSGNNATGLGGGIFSNSGSVTLISSTLSGNSTKGDLAFGGGIYSNSAPVKLSDSTLSGNSTTGLRAYGGGIFARSGDVTLTNSTLSFNSTAGDHASGGGIETRYDGTVSLINSTLSDNSTLGYQAYGGGISARTGNVILTDSTLSGNSTSGEQAHGGGIYARYGSVALTDSNVSSNTTTGSGAAGGGIFNSDGSVTSTSSTISGNRTEGVGAEGGGISSFNGDVALKDSTLSGNRTAGMLALGGGISKRSGSVTLTGSTLSENSTAGDYARGGGIYSDFSVTVTLTASTLSGNSTAGGHAHGGGIHMNTGSLTLNGSTLSGNSTIGSFADGGGISMLESGAATSLAINNSIVASNIVDVTGKGPDFLPNPNATLTIRSSLIGNHADSSLTAAPVGSPDANGNLIGSNMAPIDPLLGPLQHNGGPTHTHELLIGSPAIDAGSRLLATTHNDQRGVPFARNANATVDMGAYERQAFDPSLFIVSTTVDELDYDNATVSLREAIARANGSFGTETITFDPVLFSSVQTINLTLGQLNVTNAITISGPGHELLAIDAQQNSRVLNVQGDSIDLALSGLTLTGGHVAGDNAVVDGAFEATYNGGGIRFLSAGTLSIANSTISGNSTAGVHAKGGGIYISNGNLSLTNSKITGNRSAGRSGYGGGVASSIGSITLTGSLLTDNITTGDLADGSGIWTFMADVTLNSSSITGNSANGDFARGAGIATRFGSVTLLDSTVSGNHTVGDTSYGGGLYSTNGSLTVIDAMDWRLTEPVKKNARFALTADNRISGGSNSIEANLPLPWQNFLQPGDVNNDGLVQAGDALRIINELARRNYSDAATETMIDPKQIQPWPHLYYDQNGDGKVTALDALRIVNQLGRPQDREANFVDGAIVRPVLNSDSGLSISPMMLTLLIGGEFSTPELDTQSNMPWVEHHSSPGTIESGISTNPTWLSTWSPAFQRDPKFPVVDQLLSDPLFIEELGAHRGL